MISINARCAAQVSNAWSVANFFWNDRSKSANQTLLEAQIFQTPITNYTIFFSMSRVVTRFAITIGMCSFVAAIKNMSKFQHQFVCSIKFEITIVSHPLVFVEVDEIPWGRGRWYLAHASTRTRSISELRKTSAHSHFQIWITIWKLYIMKIQTWCFLVDHKSKLGFYWLRPLETHWRAVPWKLEIEICAVTSLQSVV